MLGWFVMLSAGGVLIWKALQRLHPHSMRERKRDALHILEDRYVRGEIGRDEFEERLRSLVQAPAGPEQGS